MAELVRGERADYIRFVIRVLVFILVAIPIGFFAVALPVPTQEWVVDYYDFIEDIPDGATVVLYNNVYPARWSMQGFALRNTLLRLLLKNDIKIIVFSTTFDAPPFTELAFDWATNEIGTTREEIYGTVYADVGFVPGVETGIAAMQSDFRTTAGGKDRYGNNLDDLPVLEGINSGADIEYAVVTETADTGVYYLRQWQVLWNTPTVIIADELSAPAYQMYLDSGQFEGATFGMTDQAAYEILVGKPSEAVRGTDATSLAFSLVIIVLVIGNIEYFIQRSRGGK